ncbi:unnamed protein product [Orchesella dallaii]|uniref:Uncharacterized protein n=1 Tax=Orchesella dallaii TaxID=48710 RepID=A0ABP1QSM7_9HEXA
MPRNTKKSSPTISFLPPVQIPVGSFTSIKWVQPQHYTTSLQHTETDNNTVLSATIHITPN